MPISSKGQSFNQSTHLLLSNIKPYLWKQKVHYVDYKWEWTSPDMDCTCKYANNNLTTKTITDTAWVKVKHPINKEQHLMKWLRGVPNWIDFCNGNRKVWLTLSM